MTEEDRRAAVWLSQLCRENGYTAPRPLPGGRYACLAPFAYTVAIITGRIGDAIGVDDRWCYGTAQAAHRALVAWDGTGEPEGWHRHPYSGRRRAGPEGAIDDEGKAVAPGALYVRL